MKKLKLFFFFVLLSCMVFGQDAKPISATLKPITSPSWMYDSADSTIHQYKGNVWLWNKFFSAKQVQHKIDSINYNSGNYYEEEVTIEGTTSYALPDTLKLKSQVWYNGDLLRRSQWNGIGTIYISISGDIRKKDYFTIIF